MGTHEDYQRRDSRNRRVPGLYRRNGRFYAQLWVDRGYGNVTGLGWLTMIADHFPRSVWLNPEPPRYWEQGTADTIRRVVPMYQLTIDGLGEAVRQLSRKG